jgi:AraC-like DNA-binding protein
LFLQADFTQQRFDPHYHDEYAIGIIEGRCQAFTYDRVRWLDMPEGSVVLEGARPIDAALAAGFSDQAHITRSFRRTLGYTPGDLARRA